MAQRKISAFEIRDLILSGVPDDAIRAKYNLTPTQLHMIVEKLKQNGLLSDDQKCPACGFVQKDPFTECPKCGIVAGKFNKKTSEEPTGTLSEIKTQVVQTVDSIWDRINCGAYRWLKSK